MNKHFDELTVQIEFLNPECLLADGFDDALIGYVVGPDRTRAVYDVDACEKILVKRDGMSSNEAYEFLQFNTLSTYVSENGPLFIKLGENA